MTERKYTETDRLYERDSSIKEFDAAVLSCVSEGEYFNAILDRTAFFPTGGGQSSDTGSINGVRVLDVKIEDGQIIHVLTSPVPCGESVKCVLDYEERIAKMRDHTAEHILSAVINKKYSFSNVGFHLGSADTTCDFDGILDAGTIGECEKEVNRIIAENHTVYPIFPEKEELEEISFRSKLDLTENVRIVVIGENGIIDKCACCAPHVQMTGKIGYFKIIDFYKYKGGTRVHILTGERAVAAALSEHNAVKELSALLSAPPDPNAVVSSVKALLENEKSLKVSLKELKEKYCRALSEGAKNGESFVFFTDDPDSDSLRVIALGAKARTDKLCAVFGGEEGNYRFVLCGEGSREAFDRLKGSLNARGGGKDVICGSVLSTEKQIREIL